jgi:hypothetical protein
MQDADGSIPFFWGVDSEDHLVFSDDTELLKAGCGNSFAPFPKGTIQRTTLTLIAHLIVLFLSRI